MYSYNWLTHFYDETKSRFYPRPRTAFPRTDTLEAKDRNARGQGLRTQAQVLSKKKKKGLHKNFSGDLHKKRFPKNFSGAPQTFNNSKIVLSSSRGQANFRGLEASRPRPRTSKSVLEDSTSARKIFPSRFRENSK